MLLFLYIVTYWSFSHLNHPRPSRLFHQLHGAQRTSTLITRCLQSNSSVCLRMAIIPGSREETAQLVELVWLDHFLHDSLLKISRQVYFRKGKNSTFDDIDNFGDDQNMVSVDNLLAQAAEDPNS